MNVAHQLYLRVGECTETKAIVYAPFTPTAPFKEGEVVGRVRGPFCVYASTLPASYPLRLLPTSRGPLISGVIVDPCPWSPDQPMLYRSELNDGALHYDLGQFAIRRFAPRGKSLYLNGKRWVLRGVHDDGPRDSVAVWRQHVAVRVVRRRHSSVVDEAGEQGLMIVVRLPSRPIDAEAFREMARSSAVSLAVLPKGQAPPHDVQEHSPNLLLAQEVSEPDELKPWAHVAWVAADNIDQFAATAAGIRVPIVAERRYRGDSLIAARAAIDTLQADLAPIGQFAGYVV